MKIAVIGTGEMGCALARAWSRAGHEVWLGSRDPARGARIAASLASPDQTVRGSGILEAASCCPVVALAVPWPGVSDTIAAAADALRDKVLVDCTNPLVGARKPLAVGRTTSGAEEIAGLAPAVNVVKAFNAIAAHVVAAGETVFGGTPATILFCGDDLSAKLTAACLIEDCGLRAWDAGDLKIARYLEPLAALTLLLDRAQGPAFDLVLQPISRPRTTTAARRVVM
jgi:NADPH-dependent F420 reductase